MQSSARKEGRKKTIVLTMSCCYETTCDRVLEQKVPPEVKNILQIMNFQQAEDVQPCHLRNWVKRTAEHF